MAWYDSMRFIAVVFPILLTGFGLVGAHLLDRRRARIQKEGDEATRNAETNQAVTILLREAVWIMACCDKWLQSQRTGRGSAFRFVVPMGSVWPHLSATIIGSKMPPHRIHEIAAFFATATELSDVSARAVEHDRLAAASTGPVKLMHQQDAAQYRERMHLGLHALAGLGKEFVDYCGSASQRKEMARYHANLNGTPTTIPRDEPVDPLAQRN